MKQPISILAAVLMILSLAACGAPVAQTAPKATPSIEPMTTATPATVPTPEPTLTPEQTIEAATTAEELDGLMQQHYKAGEYDLALLAADKLLALNTADNDTHRLRAEIWIEKLKKDYMSFNAAVADSVAKAGDPVTYKDDVARMYGEAGLDLVMPFVPDYKSPDEINTTGNSRINAASGVWQKDLWMAYNGLFAVQGEWVYFSDASHNFALSKMRTGGKDIRNVCSDGAININVIGDWIYYVNINDKYSVYKICTDGSKREKVCGDKSANLCVAGDWIFYCSLNDNNTIYKVKSDGSVRQKLGAQADFLYLEEDWLYFSPPGNKGFFRMRLDGSGQQALIKGKWLAHAQIRDGWIYYLTDVKGMVVMKTPLKGGKEVEVLRYDGKINTVAIVGDRLILCVRDKDGNEPILAYNLESMKLVLQIKNAGTEAICVDGDHNVYFYNGFESNALYRIDWQKGVGIKLQ